MLRKLKSDLRQRSRRRCIAFVGLSVVLVVIAVETISVIGLRFSLRSYESFEDLADRQRSLARIPRLAEDSDIVVHPFTGWCVAPDVSHGEEAFGRRLPVNRLGFIDDQESIQQRGDDRLIIGITGGSVAWQMSAGADEVIRNVLKQSPLFRDRDIRIIRIAQSGYKQPQQLMTVNWLMSLGAEFDAVVNLDGFNELALSIAENYNRNIHVAYPRAWDTRMVELIDPRKSATRMRLLEIDSSRQRNAQKVIQAPWKWSFTANALWMLSDVVARREKNKLTASLLSDHVLRKGLTFAESGPKQKIRDVSAALRMSADIWLRSSIQMHRMLAGSGVVYLHALQPNFHHENSKPLSDAEATLVRMEDTVRSRAIKGGYPMLLDRQWQLDSAAVPFLDLSQLYADEPATMYTDCCCHLNEEGNRRLATAIAVRLRELLETSLTKHVPR